MELMEKLRLYSAWLEFLNYKTVQGTMPEEELNDLKRLIDTRAYEPAVERILSTCRLSVPQMIVINKLGTGKKRTVFCFMQEENFILKHLAYLLKEYEYLFPDNLYSFRRNHGVKKGIHSLLHRVNMGHTWSYKADVHNYFNSVDPDRMLEILRREMPEEPLFLSLSEHMLKDPYAMKGEEKVRIAKGILAGMPVSGFLANLYLKELDLWFLERGIPYLRYSDDIIVFADTEEQRAVYEQVITDMLGGKNLSINKEKEIRTAPGEPVEFLGFCFNGTSIKLAAVSIKKLKSKLKRRARSIYRWKLRKNVPDEKAALAYIRYLNRKFYGKPIRGEITWARWYFPLLTSDEELKIIDAYALSCIRYVCSGGYSASSFRLSYERIKTLGYRNLVNSFWKYKNNRTSLEEGENDGIH